MDLTWTLNIPLGDLMKTITNLSAFTLFCLLMAVSTSSWADGTDTRESDSISDTTQPNNGLTSVEKLLGQGVEQQAPRPFWPYDFFVINLDMRPQWDSTPGPVTIVLTVWSSPKNDCTSFEALVAEHDALNVKGPALQSFELQPGDSQIVVFEIDVPANDTSRIRLEARCGRHVCNRDGSFIADSISARYLASWVCERPIRPGSDVVHEWQRHAAMMDSLHSAGESVRSYYTGQDGKLYNVDSLPPDFEPWDPKADTSSKAPKFRKHIDDTTLCFAMNDQGERVLVSRDSLNQERQRQETEQRLRDLKEREKTPCTVDSERLRIGGQTYTRRKGELKYRQPVGVTDIPAYMDSVFGKGAAKEPHEYHVVVDLSDPSDSVFVLGLVDSLVPYESGSLYHTVVDRAVIMELEQSVVPWNYYPCRPGERPNTPGRAPSPPEGDAGGEPN